MCDCNAFELEADLDESRTFWAAEQSPAGVTWAYDWHNGYIGRTDELFDFIPLVEMQYADAGFEEITELVVIDEEYLWMRGRAGIMQVPVEDLSVSGLSILTGQGIVGFSLYAEYRFHAAGDQVHDFDIVNGTVYWIEERTVYQMSVDDFGGTPTEAFDVEGDFGAYSSGFDMLIAAASDRLWIAKKEPNPTFRAYNFTGTLLQEVPIESLNGARPSDMTVERDTDVLVVSGYDPGE